MTRALPLALAVAALLVFPAVAATGNPWLTQRTFISMAHQGGEDEYPSNTIYAYKQALVAGADTLELDVNRTKDGKLVVIHDWTVDRTTNGTGYTTDLTTAQIQKLDAAYNFIPGRNAVPGEPASEYPFRGVATGDKPPPTGFHPEDFQVPTLAQVLDEFPRIPINIEIKGQEDQESEFVRNAEILADMLKDSPRQDLIVVSFNQAAVDRFHELAPNIAIAPGLNGLVDHFLNGKPMPNADAVAAIQVPTRFGDIDVVTPQRVLQAHREGWAVHVWLSGNEENARVYNDLLDHCVDGIMAAQPAALERVLRMRDVVRPGGKGTDPCSVGVRRARVASDGTARLVLRRRGKEPVRYRGRVQLRSRRGTLLGASRFTMPKGQRKASAALAMTRAGRRAFRGGDPVPCVISVRTKGARGEPVGKRVSLRRGT